MLYISSIDILLPKHDLNKVNVNVWFDIFYLKRLLLLTALDHSKHDRVQIV